MNIYSRIIFPTLIDRVMSGENFVNYRRTVLADAIGSVLEIGFGTGLNWEHNTFAMSIYTYDNLSCGF